MERTIDASLRPGDPLPACNREFLVQTMEKAAESRTSSGNGVKKEEIDKNVVPEESSSSHVKAYLNLVKTECIKKKAECIADNVAGREMKENVKTDEHSPTVTVKKGHMKTEEHDGSITTDVHNKTMMENCTTMSTSQERRPKFVELELADDDDIPDAEFKK